MTNSPSTQKDKLDIWGFIPISEYQSPSVPVSQAARKGLSQIWRNFRQDEEETESPFEPEADLHSLNTRQLEQISPALNWAEAATAFKETLQDWLQADRPDQNIVLLVEPPYGGHAEMLQAWAAQSDVTVIEPPSSAQIMDGGDAWLSSLPDNDAFWIYPTLEKTYLRHASGLGLVRRFLDHATSGAMGRGIIGCDSWAWAYLQHVWHGSRPITITSHAFEMQRLAVQFQQQAASNQQAPYQFRQANNGYYLFPTSGKEEEEKENDNNDDDDDDEISNYLQHLAAFSRGNLTVAQAIWRDSLRVEPDQELTEKQDEEDRAAADRTIWVTSWDDLEHPSLPANGAEKVAFVLHTLLLHNGLPINLLQQLLPLAGSQVMETVYQLAESGLVACQGNVWQVTARGYPVVRGFLQANGYLCDTF